MWPSGYFTSPPLALRATWVWDPASTGMPCSGRTGFCAELRNVADNVDAFNFWVLSACMWQTNLKYMRRSEGAIYVHYTVDLQIYSLVCLCASCSTHSHRKTYSWERVKNESSQCCRSTGGNKYYTTQREVATVCQTM